MSGCSSFGQATGFLIAWYPTLGWNPPQGDSGLPFDKTKVLAEERPSTYLLSVRNTVGHLSMAELEGFLFAVKQTKNCPIFCIIIAAAFPSG